MAQNAISYDGRIVAARDGSAPKITRSAAGMAVLNLVIAEQHSMKKGKAKRDPKLKRYAEDDYNANKSDDDYINTTTSWHRLTVFGEKAESYAQNEDINAGALIHVIDASYVEDEPFETRDGVLRAGRPETIGDQRGELDVIFAPKEAKGALWDGVSDLPKPGGNGGGHDREYADDEGF